MKAVLVIDMLNDFVKKDAPLEVPTAREITENIKTLIEQHRKKDNKIIYVADRHRKNDKEFSQYPPHAIKGTEGARIIDELSPKEEDIIIEKRRFSAFYGTDLDLTLRENNISELIITGILTNICVLYTTADARMRDYEVKVPRDCVTTNNKKINEFALNQMENVLGAEVI
ncbi:nicotinamidase [archaeon SCG-AAA382B04]|nr:nicotinamidase [archaeon SCG-AAA382B04]